MSRSSFSNYQVDLYRERAKTADQYTALRELQERSQRTELELQDQLAFCQQALARALQAHWSAQGKPLPSDWPALQGTAQASARQLDLASQWAAELMQGGPKPKAQDRSRSSF